MQFLIYCIICFFPSLRCTLIQTNAYEPALYSMSPRVVTLHSWPPCPSYFTHTYIRVPELFTSLHICSAALKGVRGHHHMHARSHTHTHTHTHSQKYANTTCQLSAPLSRAATDGNLMCLQSVCESRLTSTHIQHSVHVFITGLHSAHSHTSTCITDVRWGSVHVSGMEEMISAMCQIEVSSQLFQMLHPRGARSYAEQKHLQWRSVSLTIEWQNTNT